MAWNDADRDSFVSCFADDVEVDTRAIGIPATELTPPPDPAANMQLAAQRFAEGAIG